MSASVSKGTGRIGEGPTFSGGGGGAGGRHTGGGGARSPGFQFPFKVSCDRVLVVKPRGGSEFAQIVILVKNNNF